MGSVGNKQEERNVPQLSKELIDRANQAGTVVDYGDSTSRQYAKNVQEIQSMNMTEDEKRDAINRLHQLTEAQLKAESQARGPYSMGMGVARFNRNQIQQNANNAVSARDEVSNYMQSLRDAQKANERKAQQRALTTAMQNAITNGDLEIIVNGERWVRRSRRSKTFTKA